VCEGAGGSAREREGVGGKERETKGRRGRKRGKEKGGGRVSEREGKRGMQREREAAGSDEWDGGAGSRNGQGQRMPHKRAGRDKCRMHRSSGAHADVSRAWCALGPLRTRLSPVDCPLQLSNVEAVT